MHDNWVGKGKYKTDDDIKKILRTTKDLAKVPVADRGAIYNYFQRKIREAVLARFRDLAKSYGAAVQQRKEDLWEADLSILGQQRLIGMTTTGLSKYRGLIASLRPKVVLVEEAAETLEPPVAAACFPSLEHLILVGDHEQLRPHCQVRELEDIDRKSVV